MNHAEALSLMGKTVFVRWPGRCETPGLIRVKVLARSVSYGKLQLLVEPTDGSGTFWIRSWELDPPNSG